MNPSGGRAVLTSRSWRRSEAYLEAQEAFLNNFRELAQNAAGEATGPIEIWVQDESRVGEQGIMRKIWARKDPRPRIPRDRRFASAIATSFPRPTRTASEPWGISASEQTQSK